MKKKYFAALLFISLAHYGLSQIREAVSLRWNDGSITLNDETILRGVIYYSANNGVVLFKTSSEASDIQTIYVSTIVTMNYTDISDDTNKKFSWMAFPDAETSEAEVCFYEILKEYKDFVVLAKKDQVKTQVSNFQHSYSLAATDLSSHRTITQYEEIYFVGTDGNLEKYLALSYKKVNADLYRYRSEKVKFFNPALFPKYLRGYWKPVEKYAKSLNIKLNRKETIIQALDYYDILIKK